jgi:DNA repair exonuclease SbcCD ATPase subunit
VWLPRLRKPLRIDFAEDFTVIDGRNGAGKSTIFDAVEFALTGSLSKYNDAKASGETVADYLWWTGDGAGPSDRYVEVGFRNLADVYSIRRTQLSEPDQTALNDLTRRLCDPRLAPTDPLRQLCGATIIRDEHITRLSLDLKETDRYNLLREALGANDADTWIERGAQLVGVAKKRTAGAQQEVTLSNADIATASQQRDQVRANLVSDPVMAEVVARLRNFADTRAAPEELAVFVRERIAAVGTELESLRGLSIRWEATKAARSRLEELAKSVEVSQASKEAASKAVQALGRSDERVSESSLAEAARALVALVALGRKIGLQDGQCPLCAKGQSPEEYQQGMEHGAQLARRLSENAARAEELEQARANAEARLGIATREAEAAGKALSDAIEEIKTVDASSRALGIAALTDVEQLTARASILQESLGAAKNDLRILETLQLSLALERTIRAESDASARLLTAQERFGRVRKAESIAHALHDAARRAASETLDRRLARVLPLMSELYRRLRPHPIWSDIEYSIRGDVRRFMTLQVGDDLNPQFLFSSGQRRATGLAFLLSVNLSLAWSRWRTILLDDPVQHVDDFRTVHLAEVMAHLVADGRQIVCAVEDAALADLLCRRLPVSRSGSASRVTLGPDDEGVLAVIAKRPLAPLVRTALVGAADQLATG